MMSVSQVFLTVRHFRGSPRCLVLDRSSSITKRWNGQPGRLGCPSLVGIVAALRRGELVAHDVTDHTVELWSSN